MNIVKIFRFIDDYFVVFKGAVSYQSSVFTALGTFTHHLRPLNITHELLLDNTIKLLDLKLQFSHNLTCWQYEPRARKPLLSFSSGHSKILKRGVVKSCILNTLKKSGPHNMQESVDTQVNRLKQAGFPKPLLTAVAHDVLKECKCYGVRQKKEEKSKQKYAIIHYKHGASQRLKKIGEKADVNVTFSTPPKLFTLCKKSYGSADKCVCDMLHKLKFIDCIACVAYVIPLDCGKKYIGQSGGCINERLREHVNNVCNATTGLLTSHCRDHECTPLFQQGNIIYKHRSQQTWEIIEAEENARAGDLCINTPSLSLNEKELYFLRQADRFITRVPEVSYGGRDRVTLWCGDYI